MDLAIPIITGAVFVASKLSSVVPKNTQKIRDSTSPNDKPNGDNIYSSSDIKKNNKVIQKKLDENYIKSRDTRTTKIVPPLFNSSCQVECRDFPQSKSVLPQLKNTIKKNEGEKTPKELKGPMFNNNTPFEALGEEQLFSLESFSSTKENFSSLAGGSLEINTHNNMQPFFGSSVKQSTSRDTSEIHNRHLVGEDYVKKEESSPLFSLQKENIYGKQFDPQFDHYVQSNLKTSLKPVDQVYVAPIDEKTAKIRPEYKNIDELLVNPKKTYEARSNIGNMPYTRGMLPGLSKNRPERFAEVSTTRNFVISQNKKDKLQENFVVKNPEKKLSEEPLPHVSITGNIKKGLYTETEAGQSSKITYDDFGFRNIAPSSNKILNDPFKNISITKEDPKKEHYYIQGANSNYYVNNLSETIPEETRESCRVEIFDYISTPVSFNSKYSENLTEYNNDSKKEDLSFLRNYQLEYKESPKIPIGSNSINMYQKEGEIKTKDKSYNINKTYSDTTNIESQGYFNRGTHRDTGKNSRLLDQVETMPENIFFQNILK
jgi:hypothetical protein